MATMADKAKSYSLSDFVTKFGGRVVGDQTVQIQQVGSLENAQPNQITFLSQKKYLPLLSSSKAGAVIISTTLSQLIQKPHIACENPYAYFAKVSQLLNPPVNIASGIHSSAVIDSSAKVPDSASIGAFTSIGQNVILGKDVVIGAGCYIANEVIIGDNTLLYPRVTIYHGCEIGARGILHSGAVIGADGFGIAMENEHWIKIPQIGKVIIGDDVEIGANTTIDRGALDDTRIEDGVKLDNQIQVGHNVHIGAHSALAGCVGIAGSAKIGKHCRIGGGAIILGHLTIADHVQISAMTLVTKSIHTQGIYSGAYPFADNQAWQKNAVLLRNLDKLVEKIKELERTVMTITTLNNSGAPCPFPSPPPPPALSGSPQGEPGSSPLPRGEGLGVREGKGSKTGVARRDAHSKKG